MLINNIYHHSNTAKVSPDFKTPKVHSNSQETPLQTNANILQTQLNFQALINEASVKKNLITGVDILNEYKDRLKYFDKILGITVFYNTKASGYQDPVILLDEVMPLRDALKFLKTKIDNNIRKFPFDSNSNNSSCFETYKEAIRYDGIPNMPIYGIMGSGRHSTAFLTYENIENINVIKLSTKPNFPDEKHFIQGLDVPILDNGRFIVPISDNKKIYGELNPLRLESSVRFDKRNPNDLAEFDKYWDILKDILVKYNKEKGTNYRYRDFWRSDSILSSVKQMGLEGDVPCLLDHECIVGRPLAA